MIERDWRQAFQSKAPDAARAIVDTADSAGSADDDDEAAAEAEASAANLGPALSRFVAAVLGGLDARRAAADAGLRCSREFVPAGYYVYGLIDPATGDLFYVGKGLRGRWLNHYRYPVAESHNPIKDSRIARCAHPLAVFPVEDVTEDVALTIESELIMALGSRLTNIVRNRGGLSNAALRARIACVQIYDRLSARRTPLRPFEQETLDILRPAAEEFAPWVREWTA